MVAGLAHMVTASAHIVAGFTYMVAHGRSSAHFVAAIAHLAASLAHIAACFAHIAASMVQRDYVTGPDTRALHIPQNPKITFFHLPQIGEHSARNESFHSDVPQRSHHLLATNRPRPTMPSHFSD